MHSWICARNAIYPLSQQIHEDLILEGLYIYLLLISPLLSPLSHSLSFVLISRHLLPFESLVDIFWSSPISWVTSYVPLGVIRDGSYSTRIQNRRSHHHARRVPSTKLDKRKFLSRNWNCASICSILGQQSSARWIPMGKSHCAPIQSLQGYAQDRGYPLLRLDHWGEDSRSRWLLYLFLRFMFLNSSS